MQGPEATDRGVRPLPGPEKGPARPAADARRKRVRDMRYPVLRKGFDENDDANFEITKSTSESCVSMTEELLD